MRKSLLLILPSLLAWPALADTLIDNVNGIQVGADGKLQHFRAIVVSDDGKVVSVIGPTDLTDVRAQRRVDGGGRTLLP